MGGTFWMERVWLSFPADRGWAETSVTRWNQTFSYPSQSWIFSIVFNDFYLIYRTRSVSSICAIDIQYIIYKIILWYSVCVHNCVHDLRPLQSWFFSFDLTTLCTCLYDSEAGSVAFMFEFDQSTASGESLVSKHLTVRQPGTAGNWVFCVHICRAVAPLRHSLSTSHPLVCCTFYGHWTGVLDSDCGDWVPWCVFWKERVWL